MHSEDIKQVMDELSDYTRKNIGVQFGKDYPEVAQALISVPGFATHFLLDFMQIAMQLDRTTTATKDLIQSGAEVGQVMDAVKENSPRLNQVMTEYFYLGYRVGIKEGEKRSL